MSTELISEGANVVYTHKFGSDSIESFFGTLRHQAGPRASSSVVMLSLRSLMLSKIIDNGSSLASIQPSVSSYNNFTSITKLRFEQQSFDASVGRSVLLSAPEKQTLYYMSGFIIRRMLSENSFCEKCLHLLASCRPNGYNLSRFDTSNQPAESPPHEFFTYLKNFGGLNYVSYPIFNFICGVAIMFNQLYLIYQCSTDILEVMREQISNRQNLLPWLPPCHCNLTNCLIDYSIKPLLNAHLNKVNRFDSKQASIAQRKTQRE